MTKRYIDPMKLKMSIALNTNKTLEEIIDDETLEEVVSKDLFDQIKWERDIAIEQLDKLGLSLGEKMVRCKDCKYRGDYSCPMYSEEYVEWDDDGYHEWECVEHDRTHDEGFCDMGVRWE